MSLKLSIVITTYNRINMLKRLIASIVDKLGNFEYEIVVADDASTDGTKSYFTNSVDSPVLYVRSDVNQGVFKNMLLGLKNANSQVVWIISDDDDIGDAKFAIDGANIINNAEADFVFGRMTVKYDTFEETSTHTFKPMYSPQEFIDSWFDNINHLCFSSILYRKSILLECFPDMNTYMGNTIDYHIMYHAAKLSNKIRFIDKIAYVWTKSQPTSLSGKSKGDLLFQLMNIFAFPIANFSAKLDYDIAFFNKYILDSVNTLVSNYYISNNEVVFKNVIKWIDSNNIDKIYIYGKGEIGIMLKQYLNYHGVNIEFFIDDFVSATDILTLDDTLKKELLFNNATGVIIASYKCDVVVKIRQKLDFVAIKMNNVVSLYEISKNIACEGMVC